MDVVRITELQPKTYVEQGDYIAIDNQSDGTKKVQFTNLLDDTLSQENKIAPANVVGDEIATIRAAVGSPLKASTVAQMTDTNKIYVYVGSESGYTNGNWYYWNGSAWTSGGVYNSVAVVTDPTLTLSGVPADAKATGDEVTDLKSNFKHESDINSRWLYDIYGSSSENILDSEHYIDGWYIAPTPPYIRKAEGYRMSRFIYVEDLQGQQITASYTEPGAPLLFLSDAKLDNTANISEYNLTNLSRTLTVPSNAKYALVTARYISSSNVVYDYLAGMKISKTSTITADEFSAKYIRNTELDKTYSKINETVKESNLIIASSTNNILDTTKYVVGVRGTDVSPYFKTDHPTAVISFPLFVYGHDYVTVRSSNISTSLRFVVFTTNPIMDASVVVGTSYVPVNEDGSVTDTIIAVPSTAKYMYYTLKASIYTDDDWNTDTIAYGTEGTDDAYKGDMLQGVTVPSTGNVLLVNSNKDGNSLQEYEVADTIKRFTPISVGAPQGITVGQQYNRANFLFFSDSHIDLPRDNSSLSIENVSNAIKFANNAPFELDGVIHAGDVFTGSGVATQASWISAMSPFFDNLKESDKPVLFAIGNHDTNDWGNIPANAMNDTAWGTAWFDYAESEYGIIRQTKQNGHKSTWHYKDFSDKKIRVISVDVQDTDKSVADGSGYVLYSGQKAWYISNEQMNWIANTALNFDNKVEKDWGVIIVLHQCISYIDTWYDTSAVSPAYESAIHKLLYLCKAFNTQGTYSDNYTFATDSFYNLSINADFSRYASETKKPYMICWLSGHEHIDMCKTIEGINILWILNGSCTDASADSRVARIGNTSTQNAFNLISVDTTERKIRVVRYGAGKNCFGDDPYNFMPNGLSF